MRWALALLAAAEAALVGWLVAAGPDLLWALAEALLLTLVGLLLIGERYVRLRRAHERSLAEAAAQEERLRLAEDLHDVLGHELSLVALRAGGLQLASSGPTADRAAAVREQVAEAVLRLGQVVELLRSCGPAGRLSPACPPVQELVERCRRSGTDVILLSDLGPEVGEEARNTAARVVQEGLTNATKHAPGAAVDVRLQRLDDRLDVTVGNDCQPPAAALAAAAGTGLHGLHGLQRQVVAAGGRSWTERRDGRHLLRASIPLSPPAAGSAPGPRTGIGALLRRPAAATLRWALPPTFVAAAVVVAFYAWSSNDATLEQTEFDSIHPGQPSAELRLPSREAAVRLTSVAPAPPSGRCAYYTDGNFPLAMASYEICVVDGRVSRVTDLRNTPPW